jgi:uncharacterized protein GlcG (DUF336 family)
MLAADSNLVAAGGGIPIVANGGVLGALGISGAPSIAADQACAQSGIDKIKDRLK